MTTATHKKISELLEINRALAHDLDVTRRIVRDLHGERDDLLRGTEEAIGQASEAQKRLYALTAQLAEISRCAGSNFPRLAERRGFESPRAA